MGNASLHDRLLDLLAESRLHLDLDSFEQVVSAGPRLRGLLVACAGVTLLVTSRLGLRLLGEALVPISTLPRNNPIPGEETGRSGAVTEQNSARARLCHRQPYR